MTGTDTEGPGLRQTGCGRRPQGLMQGPGESRLDGQREAGNLKR